MLDECKGEKFLEILVVFSTAVVKKFLIQKTPDKPLQPTSLRLAATPNLHPSSLSASIIPLSIAYKGSLAAHLQQKDDAHLRCLEFSSLLDDKVEQLSDRMTTCASHRVSSIPPIESMKVQKEVVQNWLGNKKWSSVLLYGGEGHRDVADHPLEKPFREVWNTVISGGSLQPTASAVDLLDNLEQRVSQQKNRLQKWRNYHQDVVRRSQQGHVKLNGELGREATTATFLFNKHVELHIDLERNDTPMIKPELDSTLTEILSDLNRGLSGMSTSHHARRPEPIKQFHLEPVRKFSNHQLASESNSISRKPNETETQSTQSGRDNMIRARETLSNVSMSVTAVPLSRVFSPARSFAANSNGSSSRAPSGGSTNATSPPNEYAGETQSNFMLKPFQINGRSGMDVDSEESRSQDEADDILSSVFNANMTPHPESRMSLAERTRQSMAQANMNFQSVPELSPVLPSQEIHTATSVIAAGPSVADRRASLLERTQQSMFNLNLTARPRKSISMKKQRQSINYPVNQFETPGRPRPQPARNATPTEKLFSADAEYASVFKSRPRIQLSPMPTPNEDELPVMMEENEDDYYSDVDGDSFIRSSPLRGRG